MRPVGLVIGRAIPFGRDNVDTDVIIPARYMKTIGRTGLGSGAFETVRAEPGNVFDDPRYAGAPILIAGANFGCGSSREHAVWALADRGIAAVIAQSFSDIFAGNGAKNGIVPVELPRADVAALLAAAPHGSVTVDLQACRVATSAGDGFTFAIDPFRRECLLHGLDEIALTLRQIDRIVRYETQALARQPWTAPH